MTSRGNIISIGSKNIFVNRYFGEYSYKYGEVLILNDETYEFNSHSIQELVSKRKIPISKLLFSIDFSNDMVEESNRLREVFLCLQTLTSFLSKTIENVDSGLSVVVLLILDSENFSSEQKKIIGQFHREIRKNYRDLVFTMSSEYRINSLIPLFHTDGTDLNPWMRRLQIRQPIGKFVTSRDIINFLEFLLSDKSKALRSQQIILDYGYLD